MKNDQTTTLRWSGSLQQAIAKAARDNRRSINSEILARLEASFPDPLELTHGHLLPCPCGAGRPDATWHGNGATEAHHVHCGGCGNSVTDLSEGGAAVKWNALVRGWRVAA